MKKIMSLFALLGTDKRSSFMECVYEPNNTIICRDFFFSTAVEVVVILLCECNTLSTLCG